MKRRSIYYVMLSISIFLVMVPLSAKEYESWEPETPLAMAASAGDIPEVRALLQGGVSINAADSSGRTALMWASYCKYPDLAGLLLDSGADVTITDENGYTALHFACAGFSEHDPPCDSCEDYRTDLVTLLINAGSDVNAGKDLDGFTPLYAAAGTFNPSIEILSILIQAGADPNIAFADCWAPVNIVAANAREGPLTIELFDLLVQAGADPNHEHFIYGPPIIQVAGTNLLNFMQYLLEIGVDVNTIFTYWDDDVQKSCTALDVAKAGEHEAMFLLLAQHGGVTFQEARNKK